MVLALVGRDMAQVGILRLRLEEAIGPWQQLTLGKQVICRRWVMGASWAWKAGQVEMERKPFARCISQDSQWGTVESGLGAQAYAPGGPPNATASVSDG